MRGHNPLLQVAVGLALAGALFPAFAQKIYDPGASDTEIRIGQTKPYSGPASAYSSAGRVQLGYFEKLNSEGGVNGRKIKLISLDDAFTPPKTVEQTRKLVEQEEVLVVFNSNGTAANSAVQKYLNARKVPQLFVSSGASKFSDPRNFHWTMGSGPWVGCRLITARPGPMPTICSSIVPTPGSACSIRTTTSARII